MNNSSVSHSHNYLHDYVDTLGRILGETIAEAEGHILLDKVENIRTLAKTTQQQPIAERTALIELVQSLTAEEMEKVARAFNLFLNLSNIAEQYFSNDQLSNPQDFSLSNISQHIEQLKQQNISDNSIINAISTLQLELVLTAHPTEITRRSIIDKQNKIYQLLSNIDNNQVLIRQIIAEWWHTNEIRSSKPTPVDEAKWGFAVIEHSLWHAIPQFIDNLEQITKQQFNLNLPLSYNPIKFLSWMGGDRDGNPFVTTKVTGEVMLLSRWKAADLYLNDVNQLINELSMNRCNDQLQERSDNAVEPYRYLLKKLRQLLTNTRQHCEAIINKELDPLSFDDSSILNNSQQLLEPLGLCYQSLHDCNMGIIAEGNLKKCLRRITAFGIYLLPLDVRQDSQLHTQVIAEIVDYYDQGDYLQWSEQQRVEFLTQELSSKRPLIPTNWQPTDMTQEVLDCFALVAKSDEQAISSYIISMAKQPSDVLAVQLLLKQSGCPHHIPIVPLFETLSDLDNAEQCMQALFSNECYKDYINTAVYSEYDAKQMVMIGYSDSAKDAGVMAASWAQYRTQEALIQLCQKQNINLTLFHGRGGTIGRGGAPTHAALLSQPPGSLDNGLRVTEQGEMIRNKFGLPVTAINSFNLYTNAILQSKLIPPPTVKNEWREVMDELSVISAKSYRQQVSDTEYFINYFYSATPIKELGKLPLGSRPAKRHQHGGIETLRAIPWIFSWSQNRLLFPAWYGAGQALANVQHKYKQQLADMCVQWPFFTTRMSMLQMVYAKTNAELSSYYDEQLVDAKHSHVGEQLRQQLQQDIELVLGITENESLMENIPWVEQAVKMRNTYIDPLNLLQVELLKRYQQQESESTSNDTLLVENALMISISGIAAGLRNTG